MNDTPETPGPQVTEQKSPEPPTNPAGDAAPNVYEMDSTLPSLIVPILIAVVVIAMVAVAVVYFTRIPPVSSGKIEKVIPVEQITKDRVLVTIEASVSNLSQHDIFVRSVDAKITTAQGEAADVPAPVTDLPRYFSAYPALRQSDAQPLADNFKISPGQEQKGMFVVGFPVTKDGFDKRKSLEVTIHFYNQRPLVIKQMTQSP
jgi:hypothetical protein